MDLHGLIMGGLTKLRKSQNFANKPRAFDFKYNSQNKSLSISAQVKSSVSPKLYSVRLVIYRISHSLTPDKIHQIEFKDDKLGVIYLSKARLDTPVQVRCGCPDDYFMWQYPNKLQGSLLGRFKSYVPVSPPSGRPPKNPRNIQGVCKHTLRVVEWLVDSKILDADKKFVKFVKDSFKEHKLQ